MTKTKTKKKEEKTGKFDQFFSKPSKVSEYDDLPFIDMSYRTKEISPLCQFRTYHGSIIKFKLDKIKISDLISLKKEMEEKPFSF